jgi:hypothetical protein
VGRTSQVIKVRNEADTVAPVISFAAGFDKTKITSASNINGTIADTNLVCRDVTCNVSERGFTVYRDQTFENMAQAQRLCSCRLEKIKLLFRIKSPLKH